MIMRLIVEDRDGLSGEFYARTQEQADRETDGRVAIGERTDGHVTILAIELEDGRFGWLRGTAAGEAARALREAAAVLDPQARMVLGGSRVREIIAYLNRQAGHLEHTCPTCSPADDDQAGQAVADAQRAELLRRRAT
jgi:hypothetical protein